jgi:predicted transposase YdaD
VAVLQISLSVGQNLSTDEKALAMNLTLVYEQWRQETLEEGLQQGLQQGFQHEKTLVLRQLTRQIGSLSSNSIAQVQSLALSQIELLGEDLLDFSSPDDLDAWLRSHS